MARIDDVRELAVKVMGWQATPVFGGEYFEMKHPSRGILPFRTGYQDVRTWNPYTDANAALEVVEPMRCKGFSMQAEHSKDGWHVRFVLVRDCSWNSALELSFCESICAAALAAIREGQ